ncbi:four helix bundle protein [Nodosilinea nodulosa]|uniref:four helix bundle protein n=1 Tax=Nodosilinea nodulosa TaxID=416001 RepID=UPI00031DA49C|nr:four helix bundle protein [Nodosilinea nodulosa]
MVQKFEDLEVWKTARELTRVIYRLSNQGTFARDFGLKDQMRRAAVSVMSNIAEGFDSRTPKLRMSFLGIAKASAGELRSQAYVALDAGHISQSEFEKLFDLVDKCSRQLRRFMDCLQVERR